ncbi:MAG: macro domain-containing protein [Flavobacteriales bacterium]
MKQQVNNIDIELISGDITKQEGIEAVVNAANAQLKSGGGVAGAIHKAAGPGLEEECSEFAPIDPGQAVETTAHKLPNEYVIHCLGPIYNIDKPENELLANCYKNALKIAESRKMDSIAFPAISTGAFGFPVDEAAKIALSTIIDKTSNLKSVKKIRFVLFTKKDLETHEKALKELL